MTPTHPYAAAALDAAARHAFWFGVPTSLFARIVSGVRVDEDRYARALHQVERRAIGWRMAPARRSSPRDVTEPAPKPLDPWSVDPSRLEVDSLRVILCPGCNGSKRVRCSQCAGTQRVRCGGCGGSGRVMGAKKLKNCPTCRAKGDVKCVACRAGSVECGPCDAVGRVEHRFVVERSSRLSVVTHGEGLAIRAHRAIGSADDFDRTSSWPHPRTSDSVVAPESVDASLRPALTPHERIVACRVQTFAGLVAHVDYRIATGAGRVSVSGTPASVVDAASSPLRLRLLAVLATLVVSFAFAASASAGYAARHAWFASEAGRAGTFGGLLALAALGVGALCAAVTLGRAALSPVALAAPAGFALVFTAAAAGVAVGTHPSIASAESLFRGGDLAQAMVEADAVRREAPHAREAEAILDRIHLTQLERASSSVDRDVLERQPWFSEDARRAGRAVECEGAASEFASATPRDDVAALERLEPLRATCPAELELLPRTLAIARVHACRTAQNWDCAEARLGELPTAGVSDETLTAERNALGAEFAAMEARALEASESSTTNADRQASLREALATAERFERLGSTERIAVGSDAVRARLSRVDALVAREQTRIAQAAAREEAAAERARLRAEREAERERERRSRASRSSSPRRSSCAVTCCDGSCSPTCAYVHSGCCSRHGGVCGG